MKFLRQIIYYIPIIGLIYILKNEYLNKLGEENKKDMIIRLFLLLLLLIHFIPIIMFLCLAQLFSLVIRGKFI
jgi:hypothetical protein